ncbi:hypothetical protein BBJ28_00012957 [Nothophytophthora sp. Chile5]|nr:hypothetical protein BBJ28_00012957 [Nothophytophthora sp. Chile5]
MYMLPSEIKRNFDLMRELDKTSYPLLEELKNSQKTYLVGARQKVMARCADKTRAEPSEQELRQLVATDEALQSLQETHARVVQKLDEKIAIAAQSYDIVDHHIRRLDRDLESYAALLKANGEYTDDSKPLRKKQKLAASANTAAGAAGTGHQVHHHNVVPTQSHVHQHARSKYATAAATGSGASGGLTTKEKAALTPSGLAKATSSTTGGSGRKRSVAEVVLEAPVVVATGPTLLAPEDLPIDPNEPIYCSCRRVSFGQMVGCDNDDCKYEWFHFGCVGLTDQPAGKWYCQDCKALLGLK